MWDVICMQEVDSLVESLFEEYPDFQGGRKPNGDRWSCAVYYNSKRFECIDEELECYTDPSSGDEQSQHYVMRELREL